MTCICIKITGKVQGVYFRKYTKEEADHLSIKGFVRNEPDGSVYIEAEGSEKNLDAFVQWCHKGSPSSKVEQVQIQKGESRQFPGFMIQRD